MLEPQGPQDIALAGEVRAVALMNLGIVELWSLMTEESERHLEQGLELARKIGTPYIEVGCLSHLAVVAAAFRTFVLARERGLEAITIGEANGWETEAIAGIAQLELGMLDALQGRFEDAVSWLECAEHALLGGVDPAAESLLHLVRGWLYLAERRLEEALSAFRAVERQQTLLVAPQRLIAPTQFFVVQTLLRLGETEAAHARLDATPETDRNSTDTRAAFASLHIAEGDPGAAVEVLAPALDRSVPGSKTSTIHSFLLDALARDLLGDAQAAEASIERALDLAEPDGIVFPFVAIPAGELLERHPRHRTVHAALLSDILDVLAGSSLSAPAGRRPELREDLSESELRVLRYLPGNLSAPEIGRELYVSLSTIKTHMRHIYAKLGVHRRTEAVERARLLGLLAPSVGRR